MSHKTKKHSSKRKFASSAVPPELQGLMSTVASSRHGGYRWLQGEAAAAAHVGEALSKNNLARAGKDVHDLRMEHQEAEWKVRESMAGYVAVNQEMFARLLALEDGERQRRDAEEDLARSKPLGTTTLEERRQTAEISRLKLQFKAADDRASHLMVENSVLKDQLKAIELASPSAVIESDQDISQDDLKRLLRQLKTKEVLCTTVINELKAVRKELADACAKRDQLSDELDSLSKQSHQQTAASQSNLERQMARVALLEEEKKKLLSDLWSESGPCMSTDGKPVMRKELVRMNRQWETAYNKLKHEYNKLKVRTQETDGNAAHRRKKRSKKEIADEPAVVSEKVDTAGVELDAQVHISSPPMEDAASVEDVEANNATQQSATSQTPPLTCKSSSHDVAPSGKGDDSSHDRLPRSAGSSANCAAAAGAAADAAADAAGGGGAAAAVGISHGAIGTGAPLHRLGLANQTLQDPASLCDVAELRTEVEAGRLESRELRLQISKLQESLHQKRMDLAEEKELHEVTMAEKESIVLALATADEVAKAADTQGEEVTRLRQELQTSFKSEQRLQGEVDKWQLDNRQSILQLEELHKELVRLSDEKRQLETDLLGSKAQLAAISATFRG